MGDSDSGTSRQPNPLLGIWFRPRATMRGLIPDRIGHWNHTLGALDGLRYVVYAPEGTVTAESWPLNLEGLLWFVGAAAVGVAALSLRAWAVSETVAFLFGSKVGFRQSRGALAWSGVIGVAYAALWWIQYAHLSLLHPIAPGFVDGLHDPESRLGWLMLDAPLLGLLVWRLVAECKCVGEVAGFSAWKALLATILANCLVLVAFGAIAGMALGVYAVFFAN